MIPKPTVQRLSLYLRCLSRLVDREVTTVSSQVLAEEVGVNPCQIRKDLAYFGEFGKRGVGYNVRDLSGNLNDILGLNRSWKIVLVGVGNLGSALIRYQGFAARNLFIVAALDRDPNKIGKRIGPLVIQDLEKMGEVVEKLEIEMGIVAVPASQAQQVVDELVDKGIKGILNFAPRALMVPEGVIIRNVDLAGEFADLTFFLSREATRDRKSLRIGK